MPEYDENHDDTAIAGVNTSANTGEGYQGGDPHDAERLHPVDALMAAMNASDARHAERLRNAPLKTFKVRLNSVKRPGKVSRRFVRAVQYEGIGDFQVFQRVDGDELVPVWTVATHRILGIETLDVTPTLEDGRHHKGQDVPAATARTNA